MNKEKTLKFLWISMWATLILMVVLKLTFNYYYPIVIENSKLLEISKYIDKHFWLDFSISYVFYMFNVLVISLCTLKEKWYRNKCHFIIIFGAYFIAYPIKVFYPTIGFFALMIPYIIIPLIITKNKKYWVFVVFIIDNVLQILSNFARGNALIICDTCLVKKMMLVDYYLMLLILYIGGCHMGWDTILPWFTKKETVIDAKIEKLQCKIKKLEEKKIELKSKCLKK